MKLSEVAVLSARVAAERGRTAKLERLAAVFVAAGEALPLLVDWLGGALPQGRLGVGGAALARVQETPWRGGEPLTVAEVDATFTAVAATRGPGSAERKLEGLAGLFERADAAERRLLSGLLAGELRQGALEGFVLAALSRAFRADEAAVRRAVMLAGSLPAVARAPGPRGGA